MPFTATELTAWVETLGLSEDKKKVVLESFGAPEVLTKVGESVLARADYSRSMDALKADRTKLENEHKARIAEEDKFHGSLQAWKDGKENEYKATVAAKEEAAAKLAAVQAKIKELAPTYGIPDDQLSSVLTPAAAVNDHKDDPPRNDRGEFVKKEDYEQAVKSMPLVAAIITSLEREHLRLFGQNAEMPDWVEMVKTGKPLRQQWEERYKVVERRATLAKEQHDKEIETARREGAEAEKSRILAENPALATNVRRDSEHHSPIFNVAKNQQIPDKDKKPDEKSPQRGVAAAVQAFREKKYAEA